MDALLTALIEAAQDGANCVPINLAVGQWIVQGTPVSSSEFLLRTQDSLGNALVEQLRGRDQRLVREGRADHLSQAILQQTEDLVAPLLDAPAGPGGALSLADVTMTAGTAGTVRVTAVRVPLDSIDLWWIADFEHAPASAGGSGGVSVGF